MKFPAMLLAALCLTGCGKDIDNREAVKAAIDKRVAKSGFSLDTMTVNITSVSFHGNDADATVAFVPKGAPMGSGVTFSYKLQRQKDEWVVVGAPQGAAAMSGHGAAPGAPPTPNSGSTLPPGHPPVGSKP